MKTITKASLLVLPAVASASCQKGDLKPASKPNIIYLIFDDLGYGDLGCYGQKGTETPNIDALASRGVLFTDMYSACPLSAPSRCCIVTGKHMGHSQIRQNVNAHKEMDESGRSLLYTNPDYEGQYAMLAGTPTIASMMKEAGYKTGMIGKWGLGDPDSESTPNKMGFDYFYGFMCQGRAHMYYPIYMWENDKMFATGNEFVNPGTKLDEGADPYDPRSYDKYTGKFYSPDLMFEKVQSFVKENSDGPFMLFWTTTVPHSAVLAPEDEVLYYVNKYGDEEPRLDGGAKYFPNRYPVATYSAMITHIDKQVGLLVDQLKEQGIYDNTVFIVTSDNGPACNENSPMEALQSGGPFRCRKGWGKSSVHEGGIRMPFIVAYGDNLKPGKTSHVGSFIDLMPTFAELAGVEAPENDGISFLPTLRGKDSKQKEHEYLYWEFPSPKGFVAVRYGNWKGIIYDINEGGKEFELYDLDTDMQELHNVADQHPDIISRMWEIVKESHEDPILPPSKFKLDIPFPGK